MTGAGETDTAKVSPSRLSRQLRNFLDPLVAAYYRSVVGDGFIYKHLPEADARVLDVGSGVGRFGYLLSERYARFVGIDLSRNATAVAANVVADRAAAFAVGDGRRLPFAADSFDHVLAIGTFNRIADLEPFLTEFHRVLEPGGRVLFNCNNERTVVPHKRQSDFAHHTAEDIERTLERAGYRVLDVQFGFFAARSQKKLILSERMPLSLRYAGLRAVQAQDALLSQLPGVGNRGAHIWVAAEAKGEAE